MAVVLLCASLKLVLADYMLIAALLHYRTTAQLHYTLDREPNPYLFAKVLRIGFYLNRQQKNFSR